MRDASGIAAVEFAIILPLMLVLFVGGFDVMRMVRAADKTETASKTAADLTAQESTATVAPISDIVTNIQAAAIAAMPFNNASLSITVTAVDLTLNSLNQCCVATVNWSLSQGGTPRSCVNHNINTPLRPIGPTDPWAIDTIPATIANQPLITAGSTGSTIFESAVIVTDVAYVYQGMSPGFSNIISQTLTRHSYAIPRNLGQVTLAPQSSAPAGMTLNQC